MKWKCLLVFIYVGSHFVREALSITADDNPTVMGLQQFKTKDGKTVNLYNHIAPKLDTFGTCILDDDAGNKMSIINDENTKVDKKVNSVIKDWLLGAGKRPETYATLVFCLRFAQLNFVADKIEEQYGSSATEKASPAGAKKPGTTTTKKPPDASDVIEEVYDLYQAVQEAGNWKGLCMNLKVDRGIMNKLDKAHRGNEDDKMMACLEAYINSGEARWSEVVQAVVNPPINNKRLARKIAAAHGVVHDEL